MIPPLWMRCLRLYGRRFPIMRGKARLSKLAFRLLPIPDVPFHADIGNGIIIELWPWIWADYCTYVIGSPEVYHLQYMSTRLRPDHTMFDIGAYIGTYSFAASQLLSDGQVHTFEPNPYSADRIQEAIRRSTIANMTLCRAAISASRLDEATVALETYPPQSMLAGAEAASAETITVPVWSVDSYCDSAPVKTVDFMKIDVEGAELDVLRGAQETLRKHHPEIVLEVHAALLRQRGHTVEEVITVLGDAGYRFFVINFGVTQPILTALSRDAVIEIAERQLRKIIVARLSE